MKTFISSVAKWKDFFQKYKKQEIQVLAASNKKTKSIEVTYNDIIHYDFKLAEELLAYPTEVIKQAQDAIKIVDIPLKKPTDAFVRFVKIPYKVLVRNIRSEHVNRLISIDANVKKISAVKPRILVGAFECVRCGNIEYMPQEGEGRILEPSYCVCNEEKKGLFRLLFNDSTFEDFQKVRIQESFEGLKGGEQPQTIDLNLANDLTGIILPGQHIVINGILRSTPHVNRDGKTTVFDYFIDVNSIEYDQDEYDELVITPEDEEQIRKIAVGENPLKKIASSISPTIIGLDVIKRAVGLQLFGGITKYMPDGTHIRGDSHILLVGDPGLAKSQLLRYMTKIAPKGMYANGKSASSAGLTASAVKNDFDLGEGHWTLEAGVMVLADKGIACIDELEKMRAEDRSAIHEAMEQQTVTVAKAGITATLQSRCSVLAAANPKYGRFDPMETLTDQIDLEPPLLSRFDLIFIMRDEPGAKQDEKVGAHILNTHYAGEQYERKKHVQNSGITDDNINESMKDILPEIDPALLRKYVAYAKRRTYPTMTNEARKTLLEYYVGMRSYNKDDNSTVSATPRQLEGLVRLAESSARVRLADTITVDDAKIAIEITTASLKQICTDPETGAIDLDILTVGTGKSQRTKLKSLMEVIRELSKNSGSALISEINNRMGEQGINSDTVSKELRKLKEIGEIELSDEKGRVYV